MKIVTWNINGLRTFAGVFKETVNSFGADVLCFQETKTNRATVDAELACLDGYNSYFAFPRLQSGYSGVATYTSDDLRPFAVNELLQRCEDDGIADMDDLREVTDPLWNNQSAEAGRSCLSPKEIANIDSEGRTLVTMYKFTDKKGSLKSLAIFNLYCPRNDPERAERAPFKAYFNAALEHQAKALVARGCHVILTGDMNISHRRIDNCDPDDDFEKSPFRQWMSGLLHEANEIHFVDMFRKFHPDAKEQYTCWNSQKSARVTNFGTRIDYILADSWLADHFQSCDIHPDVMGSDHCPVSAVLNLDFVSAEKILRKCTKFWPEFTGKQSSLRSFFTQKAPAKTEDESRKRPIATQSEGGQRKLNDFFVRKTTKDSNQSSNRPDSSSELSDKMSCSPVSTKKPTMNSSWKNILKGPPVAPPCSGHAEPCVLRVVKKDGPNKGKRFFCCPRPDGAADNKEARCQFFVWI